LIVGLTPARRSAPAVQPVDESSRNAAGAPASPADKDVQVFTETLRRYQRIQFDELVSGDASLFPTIFYNEPAYPVQDEDWLQVMDWAGDAAIDAVIASGAPGPVGAESGFLSAKIAEHIEIWKNVQAWAAIEATATADARSPTYDEVASLPHGQVPFPRKNPADWTYVPFHVFDIVVDSDRATAKLAYIEPEDAVGDWIASYGDVYQIVWFSLVDGQWYISRMQSVLCPCTDDPPVEP
jgi:hypothetical protein